MLPIIRPRPPRSWVAFVDFHRCARLQGDEDAPECSKFRKAYSSLCPVEWVSTHSTPSARRPVFHGPCLNPFPGRAPLCCRPSQVEKWQEQLDEGTFAGSFVVDE